MLQGQSHPGLSPKKNLKIGGLDARFFNRAKAFTRWYRT
jgi:hypothetical protein